jgi:hypothetical protein
MVKLEGEAAFDEHLMLDDSITQAVKEINFELVKILLEFAYDRPGLDSEDVAFGKIIFICNSTKYNNLHKGNEERLVSCRDDTNITDNKCKYCKESMTTKSKTNVGQIHGMRKITGSRESADFSNAVIENPLIQAAIMGTMNIDSMETFKTQHDIINLFLQWGFAVPWPDLKKMDKNKLSSDLRDDKQRLQIFCALGSPSLSSLTMTDTILHFFNLSQEVEHLALHESKFNNEYKELSQKCHQYTTSLLDQCRDSKEVEQILSQASYKDEDSSEIHESLDYPRLLLAIRNLQKEFVVHPHCLKILDSTWSKHDKLLNSKRRLVKNFLLQLILFPITCIIQIIWPEVDLNKNEKSWFYISASFWDHDNPKTKCIRQCASYLLFLRWLPRSGRP